MTTEELIIGLFCRVDGIFSIGPGRRAKIVLAAASDPQDKNQQIAQRLHLARETRALLAPTVG